MLAAIITAIIFLSAFPAYVYAGSNLIVSADPNFSTDVRNFSAQQTIYAKIQASAPQGGTHQLNLRDNNYNLINTFNLAQNQDIFTTSLTTPSAEGYYSLEAVIESGGTSIKSVKTIQVGNSQSANVRVNVQSNVKGTTSTNVNTSTNNSSGQNNPPKNEDQSSPQPSNQPSPSASSSSTSSIPKQHSLIGGIFAFFKTVFSFVWPF